MGIGANSVEKKTDKQMIREQTRMIDRSARQVEREIAKIDRDEKKNLKEVEKLAKAGQHAAAKTVAKSVAM